MNQPRLEIAGLTSITEVGRGGSARVYSAVDEATGHALAVKVLAYAANDADAAVDFQREIRSLEALRSVPGVVAVVGHGTTVDGDPYLVMPYLAGGSCQDLIADGQGIAWRDAAQIIAKAAAAIQASHDLGIWHRDIKPANILRTASGETFVSDFGIAKFSDGSVQSRDGTSLTPDYAPPEVFAGRPEAAGDVFSLGATLAALIMGHPPFSKHGERASPLAIMQRIANDDAPDLTSYGAPPALARIAAQAMAKVPNERHASAQRLHDELAMCLAAYPADTAESQAVAVEPQLLAGQADLTVTHAQAPTSPAEQRQVLPGDSAIEVDASQSRASRVVAGLGALLLVALIAGGGWLAFGPSDEEPAADVTETANVSDLDAAAEQGSVAVAEPRVEPTAVAPTAVPTAEPTAVPTPTPTATPAPTVTPAGPPQVSEGMIAFAAQANLGMNPAFVSSLLGPPIVSETLSNGEVVERFVSDTAVAVTISAGDSVEAWGIVTCGATAPVLSLMARRDIVLGETTLADATPRVSDGAGDVSVDYSPFLQGSGGFSAYFRQFYGGDFRAAGFRVVSIGANWRCQGPDGNHYCSATTSFDVQSEGYFGLLGTDPYGLDPDSCVANEYFEYRATRNGGVIANRMDFALDA